MVVVVRRTMIVDCFARYSVLACSAYVALYHSDYLVALKYAESLLRQPRLSGAHRSVIIALTITVSMSLID